MSRDPFSMLESTDINSKRLSENGHLVGIGVYGVLVLVGFFFGIVTGYERPQSTIVAKKESVQEPTRIAEPKPEKPKPVPNVQLKPETKQVPKVEDPKREDPKPKPSELPSTAQAEDPKPKPSESPTPGKLVELLGSSDRATREKAEMALRAMGKKAEGVLRDGIKSANPAIAKKSQELLVAIVGEPKKEEPKKEVAKAVSFKEVSGILLRHCGNCHGAAGKPKDDVDVTSYDKLMKSPSGIGKSVVPGDAKKSGILEAIVGGSMPPDGKPRPSESEVTLLRNWILSGAKPRRTKPGRRRRKETETGTEAEQLLDTSLGKESGRSNSR